MLILLHPNILIRVEIQFESETFNSQSFTYIADHDLHTSLSTMNVHNDVTMGPIFRL